MSQVMFADQKKLYCLVVAIERDFVPFIDFWSPTELYSWCLCLISVGLSLLLLQFMDGDTRTTDLHRQYL